MIRNLILILTILFIGEPQVWAYGLCTDLLSFKPVPEMKSTDGLIAYLGTLLENQVIDDEELLKLIDGLKSRDVINPISEEKASISSAAQIHQEGLQKFIDDQTLDQKLLLEWAQTTYAERTRVQVAREETRGVTQEIYRKTKFISIPAGSFMMDDEEESNVLVKIPHSFEMMSTLITQRMWAEVMGENPSYFKNGDHCITVVINGKSIQMQPDHPVETISWNDVQEFIQKLNERDPIYHYRLPTDAEWEYAARAGTDALYSFGNDPKELSSYGWSAENSNDQTHPVGELKPNGFGLYDMHGNVWEWTSDSGAGLRGGSWYSGAQYHRSAYRFHYYGPGGCGSFVGARLVRTRR